MFQRIVVSSKHQKLVAQQHRITCKRTQILKASYCLCTTPKKAEIIRFLVQLQKHSLWSEGLAEECQCAAGPVSRPFDSLVLPQLDYDTKTSTTTSSVAEHNGFCSYGTTPSPVNRHIKRYVFNGYVLLKTDISI
jgi:hypothetical protein